MIKIIEKLLCDHEAGAVLSQFSVCLREICMQGRGEEEISIGCE